MLRLERKRMQESMWTSSLGLEVFHRHGVLDIY